MTQEELAEKMGVSRQTVSKWEMDAAFPEMEKAIALCALFSCSLDALIRENADLDNEAYQDLRIEEVPAFRFVRYAVISADPEGDARRHLQELAVSCGVSSPELIGWDFPFVSQEQINVYHMHGYTAAWVLPQALGAVCRKNEILSQDVQQYAVITIKEPFSSPFSLIPNAYQTLMRYLEVNNLRHKLSEDVLPCFEKVYEKGGTVYMDVAIAVEV